MPRPSDKSWSKVSLEWMSWGYGVSVTPMQTLMFYNAVANNGVMVKPRFVKELRRENKVDKVFETEVVNPKLLIAGVALNINIPKTNVEDMADKLMAVRLWSFRPFKWKKIT